MKFVWQGWVVTKQISEETDVQDVVVQAVPPTSRACALPAPSMPVGVSKPIPKLRPSSVRMLPTVTGRFLGRRNDTTGESKVNAFLIVPTMALTVMTLACVFRMLMPANKKTHVFRVQQFHMFLPSTDLQWTRVPDDQVVERHIVESNSPVGDGSYLRAMA